jgi:hypothetical protein
MTNISLIRTRKETKMTKRVMLILALALALTFVMTAAAYADHSPTFFVGWQTGTIAGYNGGTIGNPVGDSPHANYLEGTEKCGVCHSVHRAPVAGVSWASAGLDASGNPRVSPSDPKTAVAGGQYNRANFVVPNGINTQMLLMSDVANACNYCHIDTSIGGAQLFAGSRTYMAAGFWQDGFAHSNACTGCHAVHGVSSNYGNAALYGTYGTFQGPAAPYILKVRAKGAGGAGNLAYVWQDETVAIGSAGKAALAGSTIPGMAAWAAAQTAQDYTGVNSPPQVFGVDPQNVPLFPSPTDAINGTNVRPDADTLKAQASVFCTFCHQNYGYASEATVNPNGDKSLFQAPWWALAGTVPNVAGTAGVWVNSNTAGGQNMPFKNHPVKPVDGAFVAAGKAASVPATVAFANASTCQACHDAGVPNGTLGVIVQSYPHFTPGYFHFTKAAAHAGAAMTLAPPIPDFYTPGTASDIASVNAWLATPANQAMALTVGDGQCLKCHVDSTNSFGVGKTF